MVKVSSVSPKALSVARQMDQVASVPGTYLIELVVTPHGRNWHVTISRKESIRVYETIGEKKHV